MLAVAARSGFYAAVLPGRRHPARRFHLTHRCRSLITPGKPARWRRWNITFRRIARRPGDPAQPECHPTGGADAVGSFLCLLAWRVPADCLHALWIAGPGGSVLGQQLSLRGVAAASSVAAGRLQSGWLHRTRSGEEIEAELEDSIAPQRPLSAQAGRIPAQAGAAEFCSAMRCVSAICRRPRRSSATSPMR